MLISIRRITIKILTSSSSALHRPQSCRVLLVQFPFTTTTTPQPNTTTHEDPNFPIQTLKDYGFTDAQIAYLSRKTRWVSPSGYTDLLSSKMSYLFNDSGLDPSGLTKVLTSYPRVLYRSLNNTIIPSISYLGSILHNPINVGHALTRAPAMLSRAHTVAAINVELLKEYGVPVSSIAKLLALHPRALLHSTKRFREFLNVAKFDFSKKMLIYAIRVKLSISDSMWEKKKRAYMSSGWSVEEVHLGFKTWPFIFAISEEKIKKGLDFLMNVLKMTAADVLARPKLMTLSLERTLTPRCCVLNVLMGRGLVDKDTSMPKVLCKTAETFLKFYVQKYQDDVPEVLEAYHGKMKFLGFDHLR